jgi:hypothetical protein
MQLSFFPAILLLGSLPLFSQTLSITSGATAHQVFQRGPDGKALVQLSGTAHSLSGRPVEARAVDKNRKSVV